MIELLSAFTGVFVAVMIVLNGQLSATLGSFFATMVIHIIGLLISILILSLRRPQWQTIKKVPAQFLLGGTVGVGTTLFNNLAFGKISVSAILALGLLGQTITSIFIDQYGFLGATVQKITRTKMTGLAFILTGIVIMVLF